ncbi:M48 family metallopeptidase [Candidatus Poriferisodalis sp.]|uniref:M48 family metallopeptidase n=1 Tax=Candidatus Poriferisodalis sp. TaxID=3101277 RepID=UPI003B020E0B
MTAIATPADSSLAPHRDPTDSERDGKLLDGESTLIAGDLTFVVALPSDRQTIEIIVERDASLQLKIPHGTTVERAEQFIAKKRQWVHSKLSEKDALTGPPVVKQFVEGEGFAYLGHSYRLTLSDDPPGTKVRLGRGRFHLPAVDAITGDGPSAMRRWYIDTGGTWIRRRIQPWAARAGEPDVDAEVRGLGYRWGSTRPTGVPRRVSLHWAALQMPPTLIDYILVHELTHLREVNHTPDFWSTVARLMPDYEAHKTTLATIGKTIWLGTATKV